MELSHFEENGRAVMVDVTRKDETQREAEGQGDHPGKPGGL